MHQLWQCYIPNKILPVAIKIKTKDITKILTIIKKKKNIEWEWWRKTPRRGKFSVVVLCKGEFSS